MLILVLAQAEFWIIFMKFSEAISKSSVDSKGTERSIFWSRSRLKLNQSVVELVNIGLGIVVEIFSDNFNITGEWSELRSWQSSIEMKSGDTLLEIKKSIRSGILFVSEGQYVGFPDEWKLHPNYLIACLNSLPRVREILEP